jgi:cobalt-zinc-cadmium efflux system outer membrane protein
MQNWMLAGQFELIGARQQEYAAYQSCLESVRDYWLARADLEHAVGAGLPSDARIGDRAFVPPVLPEAGAESGHGAHDAGHDHSATTPDKTGSTGSPAEHHHHA